LKFISIDHIRSTIERPFAVSGILLRTVAVQVGDQGQTKYGTDNGETVRASGTEKGQSCNPCSYIINKLLIAEG
jgi:hypothetical protein